MNITKRGRLEALLVLFKMITYEKNTDTAQYYTTHKLQCRNRIHEFPVTNVPDNS